RYVRLPCRQRRPACDQRGHRLFYCARNCRTRSRWSLRRACRRRGFHRTSADVERRELYHGPVVDTVRHVWLPWALLLPEEPADTSAVATCILCRDDRRLRIPRLAGETGGHCPHSAARGHLLASERKTEAALSGHAGRSAVAAVGRHVAAIAGAVYGG